MSHHVEKNYTVPIVSQQCRRYVEPEHWIVVSCMILISLGTNPGNLNISVVEDRRESET